MRQVHGGKASVFELSATPVSNVLRDAAIASSHFWNFRTHAEQTSSESGPCDSGEESMSNRLTGA